MDRRLQLVYLHGFLSSSQAFKARQLEGYIKKQNLAIDFYCPNLPENPAKALPFIAAFLKNLHPKPIALVGSSLGGFYAQYFAYKNGYNAVLINPVVDIANRMQLFLGAHQNPYTGKVFTIDTQDAAAMKQAATTIKQPPKNLFVLLQMADEVLDAKLASRYFYQNICIIEPKGEHQFQGFERFLPRVCQWLCENLDNHKP